MEPRRKFLQQVGLLAGAFSANSLFNQVHAASWEAAAQKIRQLTPEQAAADEDYWMVIQQAYTVNSNLIILNNGGVSPSPRIVQEAVERYNKLSNEGPSYYMWRILDQGREPLRQKLALLAGCSPEEIAVNRNATEALNTVIFGLDLKAGDEVIGTKQDYPNMINAWKQRAEREGIVYKQLSFQFPIEDDDEIVNAYEKAITARTKIIHITHVINWVGQIMPVKKIAAMAKKHNLEVIVDGAHSFGLLDFKIPELGCDYFGTSLHKFLSAPIGSGMLWIKKEKIGKIWPLVCNDKPRSEDIRKFETLGTRSFPIEQGIGEAVNFQNAIGSKRKEERIRYLKNYWATRVKDIPKVKIHTSFKPEYSCAICGVSIDGMTPGELDSALFNSYKIHTVGIVWENVSCVRITPHVYTRLQDLDKLVMAIGEIAGRKK
ncbi:MAG: aminotransferase class V-fold PLP-dependent enzyme [Chitinophagaceae bacterium]|nr:aminotransferase class V-fold PLP-dependent enzyme [Chitinophagaceae bacterium]MCA6454439.1 aminotransferase class V-fold PLP-dependent enzyme [Chitinophagaceae bacterium]MCA6458793.1 aminotransferase class V-fold PLP-dependent enzyme [Chitinophagaceae bacterium]MCA6464301.1 aminotransferase class V-fold PLP-dependent enzyme [Chitinophagaceae bacterium]